MESLFRKLKVDVLYSLISFSVIGISGIFINLIIAYFYDASVLGAFNLAYSVFIVLSQISVIGIHLSVLRYIPEYEGKHEEQSHILSAALILTFFISSFVLVLSYILLDFFQFVFNSENVRLAIQYGLIGVFFLALNKVLLAYHNALRRMIFFSFFNSLRYILMLTSLGVFIYIGVSGYQLTLIISISEFILFSLLIFYSSSLSRFSSNFRNLSKWINSHKRFGLDAAFGNILLDLNTRVDVIMLGIFTTDKIVGVYSFAAMIAEGFYQLSVVFRTNINPLLTKLKFSHSISELESSIKKGKNLSYIFLTPVGFFLLITYPILLKFVNQSYNSIMNISVFSTLVIGAMTVSGYVPFQMILNQSGFPKKQTKIFFIIFSSNVFLNLALIPLVGGIGAALASSISLLIGIISLKLEVARTLGVSL